MPNKLSQFWQDLKRRNVVRVITVYTGVAFVILSLVDMIREPFELPNWSFKLVVVILAVGLIIAVILSWIYDIHPEKGMVKTEPADKIKPEEHPRSSKGWKIASYISFVVIVGLIVLNIVPRSDHHRKNLEKSIAVLPLDYLSEDPGKEYLANGVLDAITGHLSLIKGLRVMPRTSVEKYRENTKSAREIGEELEVSYLVEGSFQMVGDQVKLIIQLVEAAKDDHVFFREYDREYKDILVVQSEVAKTIANEIEVVLTPEEIQRIENIPTTNLTAHDFYLRGREEYWDFFNDHDKTKLDRAKDLYMIALNYDSTFAQAYLGLANIYLSSQWRSGSYFSDNYLDSVIILANKALSFDNQLADSYSVRGQYYSSIGDDEKARKEYEKALQLNPSSWIAYWGLARLYHWTDYVKALKNYHEAILLYKGTDLYLILDECRIVYMITGFINKAEYYVNEAFKLHMDSTRYYYSLSSIETAREDYQKALDLLNIAYSFDTVNFDWIELGNAYLLVYQYEQALNSFKKYIDFQKVNDQVALQDMQRIGYAFWMNGFKGEAEYYFTKQVDYCNKAIDLGRDYANTGSAYYDLAGVFAFRGDKKKAYEYLGIWKQMDKSNIWTVLSIRYDPLFNTIRNEPEFQQIVRDVEAKYQAEHERVQQWLEENDML